MKKTAVLLAGLASISLFGADEAKLETDGGFDKFVKGEPTWRKLSYKQDGSGVEVVEKHKVKLGDIKKKLRGAVWSNSMFKPKSDDIVVVSLKAKGSGTLIVSLLGRKKDKKTARLDHRVKLSAEEKEVEVEFDLGKRKADYAACSVLLYVTVGNEAVVDDVKVELDQD